MDGSVKVFVLFLLFCTITTIACVPIPNITSITSSNSQNKAINWYNFQQCYTNATKAEEEDPRCWAALVGVPGFLLVVILLAVCIGCGCYIRKKCCVHKEVMVVKKIIINRTNEETTERDNARLATEYYLQLASQRPKETTGRSDRVNYQMEGDMSDMGSRMQKYWYRASPRGQTSNVVVTNAPLPKHCSLLKFEGDVRVLDQGMVSKLSDLMKILREHPFLHPIEEIGYLEDRKQVIIIQPLMKDGSLKDKIYNVSPDIDWADKYPTFTNEDTPSSEPEEEEEEIPVPRPDNDSNNASPWCMYDPVADNNDHMSNESNSGSPQETQFTIRLCLNRFCLYLNCRFSEPQYSLLPSTSVSLSFDSSTKSMDTVAGVGQKYQHQQYHQHPWSISNSSPTPLQVEDVAKYGWQILKAMVFLYKKGFPVLGHVQSGNIFVQDGVCRLGGYENTLLGYRSRFYRMCEEHLEHMDVIMFGHLVFEMSCAYELTTLAPTGQDYQAVRARVDGGRELEEVLQYIFAGGFPHSIQDIKLHRFFQSQKTEGLLSWKFRALQFVRRFIPDSTTSRMLTAVRRGQGDKANKHVKPAQKRQEEPSQSDDRILVS